MVQVVVFQIKIVDRSRHVWGMRVGTRSFVVRERGREGGEMHCNDKVMDEGLRFLVSLRFCIFDVKLLRRFPPRIRSVENVVSRK